MPLPKRLSGPTQASLSRCKIKSREYPRYFPSRRGSPMATMEAPPRLQVRLHQGPFKNEAFVDFTVEENVRKMRSAIEKVRGQLGHEYDLIVGGTRENTKDLGELEMLPGVAGVKVFMGSSTGSLLVEDDDGVGGPLATH